MKFGQNVVSDTVARIHSVNMSRDFAAAFPVIVFVNYKEDTKVPIWRRSIGRHIYELQERCADFFELCDALIIDDNLEEK